MQLGRVTASGLGQQRGECRQRREVENEQLADVASHPHQPGREQTTHGEPDSEAAHHSRVPGLHLLQVEQSSRLRTDQHETDRDGQREQHEQRKRHPVRFGDDEEHPPGGHRDEQRRKHREADLQQRPPPLGARHTPGRENARRSDGEVDIWQSRSAVLDEEQRTRRHDQQRAEQTQGRRLASEQGQPRTHVMTPVGASRAGGAPDRRLRRARSPAARRARRRRRPCAAATAGPG